MALYWSNAGLFQADHDKLWEELVPVSGGCTTVHAEALRLVGRFVHDRFNNGDGLRASGNQNSSQFTELWLPSSAPKLLRDFFHVVRNSGRNARGRGDDEEGEGDPRRSEDYVSDSLLDMAMDAAVLWAKEMEAELAAGRVTQQELELARHRSAYSQTRTLPTSARDSDAWLRLELPSEEVLSTMLLLLTQCVKAKRVGAVKAIAAHFGKKLLCLQQSQTGRDNMAFYDKSLQGLLKEAAASTPEIQATVRDLKLNPVFGGTSFPNDTTLDVKGTHQLYDHCLAPVLREVIPVFPGLWKALQPSTALEGAARFPPNHKDALETVRLAFLAATDSPFVPVTVLHALLRLHDSEGETTKAVLEVVKSKHGAALEDVMDRTSFERIKADVARVVNQTALHAVLSAGRVAEFNVAKILDEGEKAALSFAEAAAAEAAARAAAAQAAADEAVRVASAAAAEARGLQAAVAALAGKRKRED